MEIELAGTPSVSVSTRRRLTEMERGLLKPEVQKPVKRVCNQRMLAFIGFATIVVIVLPITLVKTLPSSPKVEPQPDNFTLALHKALEFFNAQKSGKLPESNGISWRDNSGLKDGVAETKTKGGLVGGYYDGGGSTKYNFPLSFSMSLLAWSIIEYRQKFKEIEEYDHLREVIRWGTDYLLKTFNNSASDIDEIYSQVGGAGAENGPDDYRCWQRPEDMEYIRRVHKTETGPDLGAEMAAALAASSIVFKDDQVYSDKLLRGAEMVWKFAIDPWREVGYSWGNTQISAYYNSSGYQDEFMWGAAWMYYATGNTSYLSLATSDQFSSIITNGKMSDQESRVLSWDNKFPATILLLARLRLFHDIGFPFEEKLHLYHDHVDHTMCSYLQQYGTFKWTKGGLIWLNEDGHGQNLQYVANAAFLASLYHDYLEALGAPGWMCGPDFTNSSALREFAASQVEYILGSNPMNMSYVVGHGGNFPKHVHHRGASIPDDGQRHSCTGGWQFLDSPDPNPNIIEGAMVGGPDQYDGFKDVRREREVTQRQQWLAMQV